MRDKGEGIIAMKTESGVKEVVVYTCPGDVKIEVLTANETVWLNRQQLAILFGRDVKTRSKCVERRIEGDGNCRKICDSSK